MSKLTALIFVTASIYFGYSALLSSVTALQASAAQQLEQAERASAE